MYTVKLLTEAEIELTDACKWYEKQQRGLSKKFLTEIKQYLKLISKNPLQFKVKFSNRYRFATLKIFPYFIAYRIEEETKLVFVISIFHTTRDPINF
jgi:mRNA-degrading endonuclease RelE of RelBE toxin-antitoxin system